jgi:hypothetical protein
MAPIVVHPTDEGQAKAVRAFMDALSIEYGHINESGIEEIDDAELFTAMKEVEKEPPLSDDKFKTFRASLKANK